MPGADAKPGGQGRGPSTLLSCPDSGIRLNKLQLHPGHLCKRCAFSYKCKPRL